MFPVVCALIAVVLLTPVRAELDEGGPHNVVGYFTGGVTLQCNRDAAAGVKWWYIAPGTTIEGPVPGRFSYSGSSYGLHSLRLENLQRLDAGLYVCRSADVPQTFSPASAFLVVVADQPVCRVRAKVDDKSKFMASCRVVYHGMLNLTLSLIRAEHNSTILSRNYTSRVEGSWWHLETEVPVNSTVQPLKQYTCIAEFYSSKMHNDVAKNWPTNIEVPCESERPKYADGTHGSDTTATLMSDVFSHTYSHISKVEKKTPADNKSSRPTSAVLGKLSAVALSASVIIFIGTVWLIRRQRRQTRERQIVSERPSNLSEHANKGTSTLLDGNPTNDDVNRSAKDSPVQYYTNKTNGPTASLTTPEHIGRSQSSSSLCVSVSGSVVSLSAASYQSVSLDEERESHDDNDEDDSNEKTLMPSDGRQLAQALLKCHQ